MHGFILCTRFGDMEGKPKVKDLYMFDFIFYEAEPQKQGVKSVVESFVHRYGEAVRRQDSRSRGER